MNIRKNTYFFLLRTLRGIKLGHYYRYFWQQIQDGISPQTTETLLEQLLDHCQKNVPYYATLMKKLGDSYHHDPIEYLQRLPILTKDIIRKNFNELQSKDLSQRKWFYMTTGGSTGELGRVIHDYEFSAKAGAIQLIFSRLIGRETGECEVYLWGSEREIIAGRENWLARAANKLTNSHFFNAFRMTPEKMDAAIAFLNTRKPKLIVAYAESIMGLAKYIQKEHIKMQPQKAIISSAETLYPFMREKIERVFGCKVYNRYGTREVGNVACERPGYEGLWVAPWGNYLEILDDKGIPAPNGTDGEIIITSLMNYAMPMIRYRIDDHGSLLPSNLKHPETPDQILQCVTGRVIGQFRTKMGARVNPGYLCGQLFYRDWLKMTQIIQKDYLHILFRIVLVDDLHPSQAELDDIVAKTKLVFGEDCRVDFDYVDEIAASNSGKFHYTICEIKD